MSDVLLVETFDMHTKFLREMARRFRGELFEQRLQFGVGRGVGHSRPEPNRWVIKVVGTARHLQGEIDIGILPGKSRRHDAHNGVGLVNQLNRASHHLGVSIEMALPERITENRDGLRVLPFGRVGRNKRATQQGRDAEITSRVTRHVDRRHVCW